MRRVLHVSLFVLPFAFGGCYFTVNAAMCDQIRTDPNAVVPKECLNYNLKDAEKASRINHEINVSYIINFTPKEK